MYGLLMRLVEMPWFYWSVRWLFLVYARLFLGLRIEEVERIPREGGLVMAVNHISAYDPPVMGVSVPREISFMAKKELFDNRAMALLVRGLHAFPVDRTRSDVAAVKEAMRRLRQDRAIGIFVQGTRSASGGEALDGAAFLAQRAGVPLQPAAIWRDGRRFRVRFGEPFEVPGRDRDAIRAATTRAMHRIEAMLPSSTADADSEPEPAETVPERERDASR